MNKNNKIVGINDACYICNNGILDEMNNKIYQRNIPSQALKPQYSSRPVSTKYSLMPILDQRPQATENLHQYKNFQVSSTFNPGTAQAPWDGYVSNVNVESQLRNQFFALQAADQGKYIPSSNSDLYKVTVTSKKVPQNHPLLFEQQEFQPFNPNTCNLAKNIFNNSTRTQLKEISDN